MVRGIPVRTEELKPPQPPQPYTQPPHLHSLTTSALVPLTTYHHKRRCRHPNLVAIMSFSDAGDLLNSRNQVKQEPPGELATIQGLDQQRTHRPRRRAEKDKMDGLAPASHRDPRREFGSNRREGFSRLGGRAESQRSTERGSCVDDNHAKRAPTTEVDHSLEAEKEERDNISPEGKRFSWNSFRWSRRSKKHSSSASTDTQKHEYGEHRLDERVRWSTQPTPFETALLSSVDNISSAAKRQYHVRQDLSPSVTMSALDRLEGRDLETSLDAISTARSDLIVRTVGPKKEPSLAADNPHVRSHAKAQYEANMNLSSMIPNFEKTILSPVIGSPSLLQQSSRYQRTQAISRSKSDSKHQILKTTLPNLHTSDNTASGLSRSHSLQDSNSLRKMPQRITALESATLQKGPVDSIHGLNVRHEQEPHEGYVDESPILTFPTRNLKHSHREITIMDRKNGGNIQSDQMALTSATTTQDSIKTEPFLHDERLRLALNERPHSFGRSAVHSIASVDSRLEQRFSLGRSTLDSDLQVPSASLMSLTATPSRSGMRRSKSYRYIPLGDMEIRLVRVLPETMSTLKCEMCHRSLYDPIEYVALSYAWGDGV